MQFTKETLVVWLWSVFMKHKPQLSTRCLARHCERFPDLCYTGAEPILWESLQTSRWAWFKCFLLSCLLPYFVLHCTVFWLHFPPDCFSQQGQAVWFVRDMKPSQCEMKFWVQWSFHVSFTGVTSREVSLHAIDQGLRQKWVQFNDGGVRHEILA